MEFSNKVVLVTGSGQGIGKAIALEFAKRGANIVINDFDLKLAQATGEEIGKIGTDGYPVMADVADEESVSDMFKLINDRFGGLDILVNNAGTGSPVMVEDMTKAEWDRVLDVNLGGTFNCSKAAIPLMKKRGEGKIINISSFAAKRMSFFLGANYTASKAAILGFTRHLAFELAPHRITVNAVCPGSVATPLPEAVSNSDYIAKRVAKIPLRELCRPEDIANAVLFLAGNGARMITGTDILVDGGTSVVHASYEDYVASHKKPAA